MIEIIDKLGATPLGLKDFTEILTSPTPEERQYLYKKSHSVQQGIYGNRVYIRGLIEFSNYCKNNCYYCGIRASNTHIKRYRLNKEEILDCCKQGYHLGFRTFVMQGGEDPYFTDEVLTDIVTTIKKLYPDCAITLSVGERSKESYQLLKNAGADRFLLRFETSQPKHYSQLHPQEMSLEKRIQALWDLKKVGFITGGGFMVGSPYQTLENIASDLLLLQELQPDMVGIGPFIPHDKTKFKDFSAGTVEDTLFVLAIVRCMLPKALLPATTALSTIDPTARARAISIGCNVVMPNLSPKDNRSQYQIYNNKAYMGSESAQALDNLKQELNSINYQVAIDRGDPAI